MFLGLDLGTTNVKAVLVEPDGSVVAAGSAAVPIHYRPDGAVEQDIEEIDSATREAIAQAVAGGGGGQVQAVGVSAQGGAIQIVDGEYRPVGKVISWQDGRGGSYDEKIVAELGREWFAAHVGRGAAGVSVGQVLRLRAEQPDLLKPPNRLGFVGDAIVARLCGRAAHDATSLSIAMLYNPSLRTADPELLQRLGIAPGQLPDLLSPQTPAGRLGPQAADELSLPAGIPVSPAVHDQYAAVLGCGAGHIGDVMFGAGTAWVMLAATETLTGPAIDEAFCCTHVIEPLYGQMLSMVNGGSAVTWAAELLGLGGHGPEQIERLLTSAAPGSEGVRFWPLLAPLGGARLAAGTPGHLDGLRLSHGPAHVLRAVVEGLAFELARYLAFLTGAGIAARRLVMCGGAATSEVTPQIIADVTGVPVSCTTGSATSALGAAVIACGLIERDADLGRLSDAMAPPVRRVEPGSDGDLYRRLVAEYAASLPAAGP